MIARIIAGVFVGLVAISLVAESVEFLTVKLVSGRDFSELAQDESGYFEIRNSNGILIFKIVYSLISGAVGGYVASIIGGNRPLLAVCILGGVQVLSLLWAAFFSGLSETGPIWMWMYLLLIIPLGISIGYKIRIKNQHRTSAR